MLRYEVEELFFAYVECLDEGEVERWPDFFTDDCLYKIISRENFERGLPLGAMLCEGKGGLKDRVVSVTTTSVYHDRALRHLLSNIRVKGVANGVIDVQANYAVLETLTNEFTRCSTPANTSTSWCARATASSSRKSSASSIR